jgi:hypothetical protein
VSTRHAAARTLPRSPAPRIHRRVSGPVVRRTTVALPQPQPLHLPRVERLLDRLLRSRAWISVIGIGLMGIVAMQVSLLKLNTGISRAVQAATTLERQNAMLESQLARMGSNERISALALKRGMVAPPAGSVVFVKARPATDAARAARRIQPPSETAKALMANGGRTPGAIAAADAAAAAAGTTTLAATQGSVPSVAPPATQGSDPTVAPPATQGSDPTVAQAGTAVVSPAQP